MKNNTIERPMTTAELFTGVWQKVTQETDAVPENFIDYAIAENYKAEPLTTYEFNLVNRLDYGCNEGIYLDLALEIWQNGETHTVQMGTIKTLDESPGAMRTMAAILAEFIIETTKYVNDNIDDFVWNGFDVMPDGTSMSCTCPTFEKALERKDDMLEKYLRVTIRDNATRKLYIYEADTI